MTEAHKQLCHFSSTSLICRDKLTADEQSVLAHKDEIAARATEAGYLTAGFATPEYP